MMCTHDSIAWIHTFKANGRKTDLDRMAWLLKALGRPQDQFPAIHVVGTNGKGSVTAYLQHIFYSFWLSGRNLYVTFYSVLS